MGSDAPAAGRAKEHPTPAAAKPPASHPLFGQPPSKKSSFAGGLVGLRALGMHLVDISRSSRAGSVWLLRGRLGALCAVPRLPGRSGKVRRDGMGEKSGCCPDTPPPRGCCRGGYENAAELRKKAGGCGGIGASTCRPAQPAPTGQERQDPSPFTTSEPPHPPPCTSECHPNVRAGWGCSSGMQVLAQAIRAVSPVHLMQIGFYLRVPIPSTTKLLETRRAVPGVPLV